MAKDLETLGRSHDLSKVFNDLLTLGICSFHRTNILSELRESDPVNEALYMQTINPYKIAELETMALILGQLQLNVLDNPYSDLLGEYFMLEISKGHNGQYFTPEHVCDMMALLQMDDTQPQRQRVLDPACGSGRMLLAFAKHSPDNYFFGADNSNTCAKMAVLNFFLNGIRGEVAWMDSLRMEYYGGWRINTEGLGIVPIEKEQSFIWSAPLPKPATDTDKGLHVSLPKQQLTLF